MLSDTRKTLSVILVMTGVILLSASSRAESGYSPTNSGGHIGLGLEFGGPGEWGATGKIWLNRSNAFQPAVKFDSPGSTILQLDYLWHHFDIIHMQETSGSMPLYIGVGGNLVLENDSAAAGRLPLGISYIFDKRDVPVDIFLQVVPTLWFSSEGSSDFKMYGELGAHYYF